jgi:spoIIIJ-associated protein
MAGHKESVFEGKTLDDAVRMGLDALGLSRAEVMITVLEEGSGGFLGLGARPYRVRVMPRPGGPPREPSARGERGERSGSRGNDRGRRERGGSRGEGRGRDGREGRSGGRDRDRDRGRDRAGRAPVMAADTPRPEAEDPAGPQMGGDRAPYAEGEGRRRRRGRRGGRGRGDERRFAGEPSESGSVAVAPEGAPAGGPPRVASAEMSPGRPSREVREPREPRERSSAGAGPQLPAAELEARAINATEELLKAMGFSPRISARAEGDNVDVTAEVSEHEDLLTGRKGEVRQALQHLLNLTVNRGEGTRYHLQLEINDFWQRREQELVELARSMADDAVARGGEVVTEYLNAQERRIIHVTLREDARVKTYAIGDGLIKKLAVAPADQPEAVREGD